MQSYPSGMELRCQREIRGFDSRTLLRLKRSKYMIKFVKIKNDENDADVTFEIDDSGRLTYNTLIRQFENFLKACGYSFEGELNIDNKEVLFDLKNKQIVKE